MFTKKYRPNSPESFVGNKHTVLPFIRWLLEWNPENKKDRCALISGPCGVGKSLLVELLLYRHDYNIIHLAIDDERDKENINNRIKPLLKTKKTVDDKDNILVVSDIDSFGGDYGFIASLVECIKETRIPIICICDDRYNQNIKPIITHCIDFKLAKPSYQDVYPLLYKVVTEEKIRIKESDIKDLYDQSNGDIRFILNTLQFGFKKGLKGKNIQSTNIFETTAKLLNMDDSIDNKYNNYWLAHDLHGLLIQENYINNIIGSREEVTRLENIVYSADALSDMDIIETVVNMTNWELEPYVALNTIRATLKCNKKAMVKFPQFLGRISTANKNKRLKINYETQSFIKNHSINKESSNTIKINNSNSNSNGNSNSNSKKRTTSSKTDVAVKRGRPKKVK
jgi:replication factor C subunit 1